MTTSRNIPETVSMDSEGFGEFKVANGSVSMWLREKAYEKIVLYKNCS
ncbi:MAG: hypothetical protein IJF37_09335 [Lachnospiraceae bacterium]|nr:hypothetical protein [Lachnospiraceae bacterium]